MKTDHEREHIPVNVLHFFLRDSSHEDCVFAGLTLTWVGFLGVRFEVGEGGGGVVKLPLV